MSLFHVILLVGLAVLNFGSASPVTKLITRAPPETAPGNRRGVAYNDIRFVKYFDIYGSHVSWAYNWDSRPGGNLNTGYEFVPMLHSNHADHTSKWAASAQAAALSSGDGPTHLLGFNEPDNCEPGMGGACMDLGTAVATWKEYMEPQKSLREKMYLGSPAVTNGPNGLSYLTYFMNACAGCTIDFINVHWYDDASNAAYFKQYIEDTRKVAGGRPVWITEFRARGSDDEVKAFLDEVLPWLDASSDVHRYAYFMANTQHGHLIDIGGQSLSNIGGYYAFHA
ncbi:hypothetical protein SVAN01_11122 [Stagonosporopsis vannaccii]|nr:hypothetical protein SVAN01_11122 [Stagonosporopsis vannaccii]